MTALALLIAALLVGVVSPGPSFVMVARTAVASSRAHGLYAALGMGVGGMCFAGAAQLGLQAMLLAVPTLYLALKVLGGLYLCYLGVRIFLAARVPMSVDGPAAAAAPAPVSRAFWLGLATQLSNPKTAIVYASVFAALLPASISLLFAVAVVLAVFVVETGWYAIVALALSSAGPRRAYLDCKSAVDRVAGTVMFGLGLRLIMAARTGGGPA
jgi:threonine/homoserine/homoserine lactone efflux protein